MPSAADFLSLAPRPNGAGAFLDQPQPSTLGYIGSRFLGGLLEAGRQLSVANMSDPTMGGNFNPEAAQKITEGPSGQNTADQAIYGGPNVQPPNAVARYGGAVAGAAGTNPVMAALTPGYTAASAVGGEGGADINAATGSHLPDWLARFLGGFAGGGLYGGAKGAPSLLKSPEAKAVDLIGSRLGSEGAASAQSDLAGNQGAPLSLADVGNERTRGLAERLATQPGQAREIATQFLNDRDAASGPRLVQALDQNISSGGDAFTTAKALAQERATAAAPLYQQAFSKNPVQSPRLDEFLQDPIVREGMSRGIEIQRLEALAKGDQEFDPNFYTLEKGDGGIPAPKAIPNMRTLDAVKRGLDDILEDYRDPVTGRLNLDQRGRAINSVRSAYVDELDNLNPDYASARDAWTGPSQSIAAMKIGQNFRNMRPEMIADQVQNMPESEQQFFKLGVADSLRADVSKTSLGGNEALRIVGNDYTKQQLRPLFDTEDGYNKFIQAATNENRMFQTRQMMLGNSRTAARMAEMQAGEGGFLSPAIQGGMALATHEPVLGLGAMLRAGGQLARKFAGPSAATQETAARALFSSDPNVYGPVIQQLMAHKNGQGIPMGIGLLGSTSSSPQKSNGLIGP